MSNMGEESPPHIYHLYINTLPDIPGTQLRHNEGRGGGADTECSSYVTDFIFISYMKTGNKTERKNNGLKTW